jgi:hypothetical protein
MVPPDDLAPSLPADLTPDQYVTLWREAYDAGEELLLAGLAREVGPGGDVAAAYRRWNETYLAEHDEMIFRMMANLDACEKSRVR